MTTNRPFPASILDDFRDVFLGDLLGSGVSRDVYAFSLFPQDYVVKVETGKEHYFQNVIELNTWTHAQYTDLEPWLAPVVATSRSGKLLVMRRAEPIRQSELPKVIPAFLSDLHVGNWGMLNGRPVAIDYGWSAPLAPKMKKAKWDAE